MIDIHNHLMYGIDDGCKTLEESIKVLEEAAAKKIHSIIVTPHYIKGSRFEANNETKESLLNEINEKISEKGVKIKLYMGNEVYVENDMLNLLEQKKIASLNHSRYLLFELPMGSEINNLSEIIFNLRVANIIPVIAHPERYFQFQKKPELLIPLIEQGCLFQSNLGSLIGLCGKEAKNSLITMLKHNYIHFMASDVHHPNSHIYTNIDAALKMLEEIVGSDYANELVEINPQKIIDNNVIVPKEPKVIKKGFFSFKS